MCQKKRYGPLTVADLRRVWLLRDLPVSDLEELLRDCHDKPVCTHDVIISHGDDSREVYFILEGVMRVNVFTPEGDRVTYEFLEEGETFGELSAIDGGRRSAEVVAESCGRLAWITHGTFRALLSRSPKASWALHRRMAWMSRWLAGRLYELYALPVRDRLICELIRLCDRHDDGTRPVVIAPPPTDRDLASRINAAREQVNRVMGELRKAGLIERRRTELLILDPERLRGLGDGCAEI